MAVFQTPPTRIDYRCLHFLIMDAPSDSNLAMYLQVRVDKHLSLLKT